MKRVGAISLKRYALESAVAILNAFPCPNIYMVLVQRGQGLFHASIVVKEMRVRAILFWISLEYLCVKLVKISPFKQKSINEKKNYWF